MTFRLYIVPVVGSGSSKDPRRPKYFSGSFSNWTANDYGLEAVMIVGADLAPADDTAVTANADVTALPFNLDANLTAGQVTTTQTKLEALNIPAGWVSTSLTWRTVARLVLGMFQFMQRYNAISNGARLFLAGVDLSTQFSSLPAQVRADLIAAADSLGYDRSSLSGASTLRQILKTLADNWQSTPIQIGASI